MNDNKLSNTEPQTAPQANPPGEKVVFQQGEIPPAAPPAAPTSIPEEYLTDEDLYPAQNNGSGNVGSAIKKKTPVILVAIVALFVFLALLFVLTKLFGGGTATSQTVKLTYWGVWQPQTIIGEVIADYQKDHPNVQIEYTLMDAKDNYRERVIERARNGTGPDIFRFHNTWVSSMKELFAPAPNTIMTSEDYKALYYPVIVKDLVVDNQVIGFPYNLDGLVLLYNDSLLKDAGISEAPKDWEELINDVNTITVKDESGNIVTSGMALGTAENISHFSDILGLMFLQNGVDIGNVAVNDNAATVLNTYTDFVLDGEPVWSEVMNNSINEFAEGKVAMIFAPVWQIEVIKHLNPDLDLKVASVPQIRGGSKKNIANYWADGVSRGSKYQSEAWDFLKYLSQKEQQAKLYELEVKSGRLFGNIYPRMDMAELLLDNEYLAPLVRDANILDSLPLISRTYDNGINDDLVNGYLKDAVNSILLNSSTQDAIGLIDRGVKEVFPKYNYTFTSL